MKPFRRLIRYILLLPLVYIFGVLLHGYFADWQPEEKIGLTPLQNAARSIVEDSVLTFSIWNVGYGGLGAGADFFYDDEGMFYSGSSMIRSPRTAVEQNLAGVLDYLKKTRADFFLLQEVDERSDRSYRINQYAAYAAALLDYAATMGYNYRCSRVPIPILEPWHVYGAVASGLGTFSRFQPAEAVRYQLPGVFPFPKRMFELDRCIAVHRFPTKFGKDLVAINIHNSAYDPGDKIKAFQLPYLRDLALREYERGNYVVLGGDWNQCPPNLRFDLFMPGNTQGYEQGNIPGDLFPEDWIYGYDPTVSTNRKARDVYEKGKTFETLIDFFIVSPNVRIEQVKGLDSGYRFSDHQAVEMRVRLL
jgi:endonuclease/exonuclease/phosphatase family metal-dependent hydrolase